MAWETQGYVTDRAQEHLGVGDEGIIVLRKLLKEQIARVEQGLEPLGIIRDPEKNRLIDLGVINERIGLFRAESSNQAQTKAAS
jgi:5,5'-dehydrodivanillate O-demethylase oxygenase subunit